jgi:hypothetical protein
MVSTGMTIRNSAKVKTRLKGTETRPFTKHTSTQEKLKNATFMDRYKKMKVGPINFSELRVTFSTKSGRTQTWYTTRIKRSSLRKCWAFTKIVGAIELMQGMKKLESGESVMLKQYKISCTANETTVNSNSSAPGNYSS